MVFTRSIPSSSTGGGVCPKLVYAWAKHKPYEACPLFEWLDFVIKLSKWDHYGFGERCSEEITSTF